MSSLLESAIAAFLDSLGERELDEPLRAVLRARGFSHIHFVHGASEFGRDFIARRDEPSGPRQYALQAKAGDLNLAAWQQVRNQIEEIRTGDLSHPAFDAARPRTAVVVTTGRLVGDARLSAQTYQQRYADEIDFDVWDRDRLVEYMTASPDAALAGRDEGPLLRLLGEIDADEITDIRLEHFSRHWLVAQGQTVGPAAVLEAALLADRLRRRDRLDLACFISLALLRAAAAAAHSQDDRHTDLATCDQAAGLFATYATALWERCKADEDLLRPVPFVNKHSEFGFFVTYSVRCSRVIEILSLLALRQRATDEQADEELMAWIRAFIAGQPGCAHPLSDRHAVSLIPPAILFANESNFLEDWFRELVRWIADRHDDDLLGLAPVHADPRQEVEYLLSMFEHIAQPTRRGSFLAAVVLDLASILGLSEMYEIARNEFLAVGLVPELLHLSDSIGQYIVDGEDVEHELNPPYRDEWSPDAVTAPHLAPAGALWLEEIGRAWELLATFTMLRDRHHPGLVSRLASRS
jgi:hypothetical protein